VFLALLFPFFFFFDFSDDETSIMMIVTTRMALLSSTSSDFCFPFGRKCGLIMRYEGWPCEICMCLVLQGWGGKGIYLGIERDLKVT
jgi:hypothetical protein